MEQVRLLTLGGVTLQTGGVAVTGAPTRRHRLALLALLALARDRGLSRDKLQAYLWPESDAAHARHGLNQLLYFQRRHLYGGGVFLGRKTLRLNPAVITTDVWDFEDALDASAPEAAVQIYAGPFLDGFLLQGAPEFERWVAEQRHRLQCRCIDAIARLARAAMATGDLVQALGWWRRATEVDPFDAEAVRYLVETSLAVGDRAAALRQVHHHVDLLRNELGLEPDAEVIRLLREARGGIG